MEIVDQIFLRYDRDNFAFQPVGSTLEPSDLASISGRLTALADAQYRRDDAGAPAAVSFTRIPDDRQGRKAVIYRVPDASSGRMAAAAHVLVGGKLEERTALGLAVGWPGWCAPEFPASPERLDWNTLKAFADAGLDWCLEAIYQFDPEQEQELVRLVDALLRAGGERLAVTPGRCDPAVLLAGARAILWDFVSTDWSFSTGEPAQRPGVRITFMMPNGLVRSDHRVDLAKNPSTSARLGAAQVLVTAFRQYDNVADWKDDREDAGGTDLNGLLEWAHKAARPAGYERAVMKALKEGREESAATIRRKEEELKKAQAEAQKDLEEAGQKHQVALAKAEKDHADRLAKAEREHREDISKAEATRVRDVAAAETQGTKALTDAETRYRQTLAEAEERHRQERDDAQKEYETWAEKANRTITAANERAKKYKDERDETAVVLSEIQGAKRALEGQVKELVGESEEKDAEIGRLRNQIAIGRPSGTVDGTHFTGAELLWRLGCDDSSNVLGQMTGPQSIDPPKARRTGWRLRHHLVQELDRVEWAQPEVAGLVHVEKAAVGIAKAAFPEPADGPAPADPTSVAASPVSLAPGAQEVPAPQEATEDDLRSLLGVLFRPVADRRAVADVLFCALLTIARLRGWRDAYLDAAAWHLALTDPVTRPQDVPRTWTSPSSVPEPPQAPEPVVKVSRRKPRERLGALAAACVSAAFVVLSIAAYLSDLL